MLSGGTQSLSQFHDAMIGDVGAEVQLLNDQSIALDSIQKNMQEREQAEVGVDVNEETLAMLQYQKMVEMASKYLSVVNEAMDSLLGMFN